MALLTTQLTDCGLSATDAQNIAGQVTHYKETLTPTECWKHVYAELLKSANAFQYPFKVHELLYKTIYPEWNKIPCPTWFPNDGYIQSSNIAKMACELNFRNYQEFHRWSSKYYPEFWQKMVEKINIIFDKPYTTLVDLSNGIDSPQWFLNAKLNITKSCFQAKGTDIAIISQTELGITTKTSYAELDTYSNQIANSLSQYFKKGDRIAIDMPMTREAVALYLGIIKAGCTVVSIADSFAPEEIATRLRISNAKAIFCQDQIIRSQKRLPLYEKVTKALESLKGIFAIVLPAEKNLNCRLNENDINWNNFLINDVNVNENFTPLTCDPGDYINILFSSGTTGDPKAIPWTQTAAIKCASDAYLHHNVQPQDVFCWPTNLGWMMGPWLIFACLLNKATIALYEGPANGKNFGNFIQNAKVNLLGVVPTMVKTWRTSACMEGLNWQAIKLFTSTAECSNIEDMLYLKYLANYRPIIEYCGGTEISGAYITSTVIHPSAPAACTTPALGLDFVILNEETGEETDNGEVALIPPSIGLSTTLLNKDHHQVYYADMPKSANGKILRRHGDHIIRYPMVLSKNNFSSNNSSLKRESYFLTSPNHYYRLLGRTDDTMNLGGIKVSSAEIELVLNAVPGIYETAAIAIEPPSGGPSQLIIYFVPNPNTNTIAKIDLSKLKSTMQTAIKVHLNPLFRIQAIISIEALPRTASNKVMRRVLRDQYLSKS